MSADNEVGAAALIKAAGFFWDQGLKEKALALATRATEAPGADDSVWAAHLALHRAGGDLTAAAKLCQTWIEAQPQSPLAAYTFFIFGGGQAAPRPQEPLFTPAPFLLCDGFLTGAEHSSLLHFLDENIVDMLDAKVVTKEGSKLDKDVRSARVKYGTESVRSWFLPLIRAMLPKALPRLHLKPFEVTSEELQITASFHGDFYKAHRDADIKMKLATASRRVSFVYYFRPPTGHIEAGHLRLYDSNAAYERHSSDFTAIEPVNNRLIIFRSEAMHEVMPTIARSGRLEDGRYTVNGWLHGATED